jgi:hypothetical protein
MEIVIRRDEGCWVKIFDKNSLIDAESKDFIGSTSVEVNLLFAIIEKLEEIRCGIIDLENFLEKQNGNHN